jgi:RNA polymerase sigma-70 factor (ECF subfamily)
VRREAWRGRGRFRRDRAAFSTWLFAIARNVAIDYFRWRRLTVPLEAAREQADGASLDKVAQQHDDLARLGTLLGQLPARERELIAFKYGAGLTNRSIARLTGLSEFNVGTILHRVRQRLRTRWEQRG